MPERNGVRLKVVHGSYGLMYLIATLAGIYGLFHPAGQVQALYGTVGNVVMVSMIATGGILGLAAYLFRILRLELLGAPLLTCAVAFIAPALFYAEIKADEIAWYGWLTVALGMSLIARWTDVRVLIEHQRQQTYRGRRRQER